MYAHEFPIGTTFTRPSIQPPVGTHYGVHVGEGRVLDLQKGDNTCAHVRIVEFDEFAAGQAVGVEVRPAAFDEGLFWQRVQSATQAGCIAYRVLGQGGSWNCEALTRWLVSGVKRSYQGDRVVAAVAAVGIVGLLAAIIGIAVSSSDSRRPRRRT